MFWLLFCFREKETRVIQILTPGPRVTSNINVCQILVDIMPIEKTDNSRTQNCEIQLTTVMNEGLDLG